MNPIDKIKLKGREVLTNVSDGYDSIKNEYRDKKPEISFELSEKLIDLNSSAIANLLVVLMFLSVLFWIDQTKEMIQYYLENTDGGIRWSFVLVVLLCACLYIYTQQANILRRQGVEVGEDDHARNRLADKYGVIKILASFTPLLAFIWLIWSIGRLEGVLTGENITALVLFGILSWMVLFWRRDSKHLPPKVNYRWRIGFSARLLTLVWVLWVLALFSMTHIDWLYDRTFEKMNAGKNLWPFHVLVLVLISGRFWMFVVFYFFKKSPSILRLQSRNFENKEIANLAIFVVLLILIFRINMPTASFEHLKLTPDGEIIINERSDWESYVDHWMDNKKSGENIYLVAGQGGGSRAGFWMASALAKLDSLYPPHEAHGFYNNCLAMSTVSGSSVGAAVYISAKKVLRERNMQDSLISSGAIEEFFNTDFLSASMLRLFFVHPIQKISSVFKCLGNRNEQLQWDESRRFYDLFQKVKDENANYRTSFYKKSFDPISIESPDGQMNDPVLVLNTYNVTRKKRSYISPLQFDISGSDGAEDLLDSFSLGAAALSYSQAVNLSQMFPVMSGSSTIEHTNSNYYDGGVFDNYGLTTVSEIYEVVDKVRSARDDTSRIVVIFNQNSITEEEDQPEMGSIPAFLGAVSGSLFGAVTEHHKNQLAEELSERGDTLITIKLEKKVTLNRWLSEKHIQDMTRSLKNEVSKIDLREL